MVYENHSNTTNVFGNPLHWVFDKESSKKGAVEKPVAEKPVMGLVIETPVYTSLLELFMDAKNGHADKWENKWVIFEGHVRYKTEDMLYLSRPGGVNRCSIAEELSNPQLYKYEEGQFYLFSARVLLLYASVNAGVEFASALFMFVDRGEIIIPPDYTGIIDVDLEIIGSDVMAGGYEKWVGKRVRFKGKVNFKSKEGDTFHIGKFDDKYGLYNFGFIISGFEPHGEVFRKYESGESYTFTVKIEDLSLFYLTLQNEYRLVASIIDE